MAPKTVYGREQILEAAINIIRKTGLKNLSAQAVAKELNGSTMPIYVQFPSMVHLRQAVDEECLEILKAYQAKVRTGKPFYDMGLGYIAFAREEQRLFREVYLPMQVNMTERGSLVMENIHLMETDPLLDCLPRERLPHLLMKMWIFVQGLASMSSLESFMYKDEMESDRIIDEVGQAIIRDEIERYSNQGTKP